MNKMNSLVCFRFTLAVFLSSVVSMVECRAQVVQLPSYRSFSTSGSALVPDRGTATLGGGGYSSSARTRAGWGPYANSAASGNTGATSISASVQIIDLAALDEAILAVGNDQSGQNQSPDLSAPQDAPNASAAASDDPLDKPIYELRKKATYLTENTSERAGADPGAWQRALAGGPTKTPQNPSMLESDIRYYVMKGAEAENAGSLIAARVYYKLARDAMTPELISKYHHQVAKRKAAEEARRKAELEAGRRSF